MKPSSHGIRAIYSFRDLPLAWTTVGNERFHFCARASGQAHVVTDAVEPFWLEGLHLEATCPQTGETRLLVVTRHDDLFDLVDNALRTFREGAIADRLKEAAHEVLKQQLRDSLAEAVQ